MGHMHHMHGHMYWEGCPECRGAREGRFEEGHPREIAFEDLSADDVAYLEEKIYSRTGYMPSASELRDDYVIFETPHGHLFAKPMKR